MPVANPFASFDLWGGLFGGLALFLFGLDVMTQALKSAAGDYMKDALGRLTRNRFVGVCMGAFATAVIQSSSVTTVILVGFISAGLLSMSQSVAVIMGANIGSTVTAQILAFDVDRLALPMLAAGFAVSFLAKRSNWRQSGLVVLGLGLVFYGMGVMSSAMSPLRAHEPFIRIMAELHNPALAVLIGAAFTAVVQSSAVTIGILIVLATQGLLNLEPAIAITLGANIGTCITAALASIGKPREAVRASVVHTLFNVAGVLLWLAFIPQLAEWAQWLSPVRPDLAGAERLAAEVPRQIANAHTLFNVANTLLFLGFTTQFARLVVWLVPDKPLHPDQRMLPRYLHGSLLSTPPVALQTARLEIGRLGECVNALTVAVMPAAIRGSRAALEAVAGMDKAVDALHLAIIEFLGRLNRTHLTARQSGELMQLVEVTNNLEHIGDLIATSMVASARKRIDEDVSVSEQTARILTEYHAFVLAALNDALRAVTQEDAVLAKEVSRRKKGFSELSHRLAHHGLDRLAAQEPNRLKTYAREMEAMEILGIVFTVARRIARSQMKLAQRESVPT
ncbi:MAG: Na/Pi cotransporter family protein [Xanthomonadales bacterium]|nr:Na/Pi cotransporter family protein [Xanthomonadales bacterium]